MLHIDRTEEWNLICRMLETMESGEYTIKRISALLGFSMYSKHLHKLPIWEKLKNEGVFRETGKTNTGADVYYFDWELLRKKFIESNMVQRAMKATKGRLGELLP
jgi:hypothetical protein